MKNFHHVRKAFVTGGAGFIGSAFVRLILAEDPKVEVTNFDALTYAGNPDNLFGLEENRHRFVCGDISDRESVNDALEEGTDTIINFAAESHVDRSITSALPFLRTNVIGTQILLDLARERGVGRFMQISTDEVMGSLEDNDDVFFTESTALSPRNPYAASKAAAEHLVSAAHHTFGLDTVVTRCGNNYGPRQFPEKLIPLVLSNALSGNAIPIYGDGLYTRDWIYVEDHCRAVWVVAKRGRSGSVYNIGARNERRNIEVVRSILKATGSPDSLIKHVKDRPGHDRRYALDPTLIESELGWRPNETWSTGLTKTIRWYMENDEWLARARSGAYRDFYKRQYGAEVGKL